MGEKIFGDICNSEELNELANNLRRTKEYDEIRLLCSENGIDSVIAEEFIKGNRLTLVEMRYLENRKALQSPTWQVARSYLMEHQTGNYQAIELIRTGMLLPDKEAAAAVPDVPKESKMPAYTLEDVKEKLEAELKIYRDGDSKYVIEKLIELCRTDKGLLDAVMLPHKSYDKAFQYFFEHSRTVGYKMPHGNMVYLDNDRAVELSVEYFKKDDAAEAKRRADKKKEQSKPRQQPQPQKKPDVKAQMKESKKAEPKETKQIVPEMNRAKQEPKPKKNEMNGQLSLFDF